MKKIIKKILITNWVKAKIWDKNYIDKKDKWVEHQVKDQKQIIQITWVFSYVKLKNLKEKKNLKESELTLTKMEQEI